MIATRLISAATAHPPSISTSDLEKFWNLPTDSLSKRGRIERRHWASLTDKQSSLAAQAVKKALKKAKLELQQVNAIVSACAVPEQSIPCTAALIGRELNFPADASIACFDINATCLSFLVALDLMAPQLAMGRYKTIVIVSADLASRGVNPNHLESAAIFGDGVIATVWQIDPEQRSGILASQLTTYPQAWDSCQIKAGGTAVNASTHPEYLKPQDFFFEMDGKEVFKYAARFFPQDLKRFLTKSQMTLDDFDWVIPHQASDLGMHHIRKLLQIDHNRLIDIYAEHGNQVAASMPCALAYGIEDGRIQRGQKLLLIGTGAGLSIGFMALTY